jgi:hypothetical protein
MFGKRLVSRYIPGIFLSKFSVMHIDTAANNQIFLKLLQFISKGTVRIAKTFFIMYMYSMWRPWITAFESQHTACIAGRI